MEEARTICVLSEWPLREGFELDLFTRSLLREGISADQITFVSLLPERPYNGQLSKAAAGALEAGTRRFAGILSTLRPVVILALGEGALATCCPGYEGIDKWQCSVLAGLDGCKTIPAYPAWRVQQDLSLQLWISLSCRKVAAESSYRELRRPDHEFLLNPPLDETMAFLRGPCANAEFLSVDIETGRGQINTVGFAISPSRAIAINVLPDRLGADSFHALWSEICLLLESDRPKILQNFIYETLYFSRYGVRLSGVTHDTMLCQKFLWPEFEMGLDAVGRMYSGMPYWKEDGKDWSNVRDWNSHYAYNCKDTCGTFEGFLGQRKDLEERGLASLHSAYLGRIYSAVAEMCSWGLPVSEARLCSLRLEVEGSLNRVLNDFALLPGAEHVSPRSPKQLKAFLSSAPRKYKIPKKYVSAKKAWQESTDAESLKKLRLKYPEDPALPLLLDHSKLQKALSSYLNAGYDADGRMRYSLRAFGTETGRMAGGCDPWDRGVNPQTIPGGQKGINIKSVFEVPAGHTLLSCDLQQAESRFVAYDAPDLRLIQMLEDPSQDIHSYVGEEICRAWGKDVTAERSKPDWKKTWRQLGKKSGHGANYGEKEQRLIDTCLAELDVVLTKPEATKVLEAYHKLFPGIRQWHSNIRREVAQTRRLGTPWGWERQFWGRLDDDTFREAYAFRPQSTIPYITNQLMLHLLDCRRLGQLRFNLLLQCHDSLLLEVADKWVSAVAKECLSVSHWHPVINLAGGRLVIPSSVETGRNYGELEAYEG